jgi:hypothetical protein
MSALHLYNRFVFVVILLIFSACSDAKPYNSAEYDDSIQQFSCSELKDEMRFLEKLEQQLIDQDKNHNYGTDVLRLGLDLGVNAVGSSPLLADRQYQEKLYEINDKKHKVKLRSKGKCNA